MELSPELSSELSAVARRSRIEAVAFLRSRTGCGLAEAMDVLAQLVPIEHRSADEPSASVYAFGRASTVPSHHARSTPIKPGRRQAVLVTEAFGQAGVARLAEILGIDPSDPNQHHLNVERIDWAAFASECADGAALESLREAGFSFHFVPDRRT
jgi:hypothetical protein